MIRSPRHRPGSLHLSRFQTPDITCGVDVGIGFRDRNAASPGCPYAPEIRIAPRAGHHPTRQTCRPVQLNRSGYECCMFVVIDAARAAVRFTRVDRIGGIIRVLTVDNQTGAQRSFRLIPRTASNASIRDSNGNAIAPSTCRVPVAGFSTAAHARSMT